jgi:hypothetical protein
MCLFSFDNIYILSIFFFPLLQHPSKHELSPHFALLSLGQGRGMKEEIVCVSHQIALFEENYEANQMKNVTTLSNNAHVIVVVDDDV